MSGSAMYHFVAFPIKAEGKPRIRDGFLDDAVVRG